MTKKTQKCNHFTSQVWGGGKQPRLSLLTWSWWTRWICHARKTFFPAHEMGYSIKMCCHTV